MFDIPFNHFSANGERGLLHLSSKRTPRNMEAITAEVVIVKQYPLLGLVPPRSATMPTLLPSVHVHVRNEVPMQSVLAPITPLASDMLKIIAYSIAPPPQNRFLDWIERCFILWILIRMEK